MRYNLEFKVKAFPYTNWYVWIVGNQLIEIGTTETMSNNERVSWQKLPQLMCELP